MKNNFILIFCEVCQKKTRHTHVKVKESQNHIEGLFKCLKCGNVTFTRIDVPKSIEIKVIHSVFDVSSKKTINVEEEREIRIGDEIKVDGRRCLVTSIEVSDGRRVEHALARNISTIWVKDIEKVRVKISINAGRETLSKEIICEPERDFCVGDILNVDNIVCKIHKIRIREKFVTRGCCKAKDIVRIYSKILNNS